MSTSPRAKSRPRRIAADEAHSWARHLRLNNPTAKLVLSMLTLYVDGDGTCFVGIPSLAEDTELSPQTVRDRLAWLERAGAIVRSPQWIDQNGRRNGEANGRRTSDLIRLLIDTPQEDLESRAAALRARKADPVSQTGSTGAADPIHGIGSDTGGHSAGPAPTLRRPYDSAEGLISEPEPEPDSPLIPSGDEREPDSIEVEEEPEHFGPAWLAWRGHEVMRRDLALAEFRQLSPEKQQHCRAAIPLFNAMQDQFGRTRVPNFHLWIRSRGFDEFPTAASHAPAAATPAIFEVSSREGLAIKNLHAVAKASLFENHGRVIYRLPLTARVLAFAELPNRSDWHWIEDRNQIAAWSTFLSAHIASARGVMETTRVVGAEQRRGIYAPWPWPPRKDGSIAPAPGAGGANDSEVA